MKNKSFDKTQNFLETDLKKNKKEKYIEQGKLLFSR